MSLRSWSARLPNAGVLCAGVLSTAVLAGCGSSPARTVDPLDGVPSSASAAPVATLAPTGAAAVFPLTGVPAPNAAAAAVPVVAVALDAGAAPLAGTGSADVVYVDFPSSGRQRGLALFQSQDAAKVGPVGDTRPLDDKLLVALGAVLEHSGGPSGFVKQVGAADLPEWSSLVEPDTFSRDAATGQVYGSTTAARAAKGAAPARAGLLLFAGPTGSPASSTATPGPAPGPVAVQIPGQSAISLTYDPAAGTWHATVGSFPVTAKNVVLQEVTYDPLLIPHSGGRSEGSPDVDGDGKATILSGPTVDIGTWNRPGRTTSLKYVGSSGAPTRLQPGSTWVLLVPKGTTVTPTATS